MNTQNTTTENELQTKIAALTVEYNFKEFIKTELPNIDTLAFIGMYGKKTLVANCKSIAEFNEVLSHFCPTNTTQIIGSATSKEAELNTPYRMDIDNPCSYNQYHPFTIKISYTCNDVEVDCKLPIELISEFVHTGERCITDSEYHYFTGVSTTKLRTMRVRQYLFNGTQISWYGGNKTLTSESEINDIITHLTNQ